MDDVPNESGRFRRGAVKAHLALHHPRCPEHVCKHVIWALRRKRWTKGTALGRAVGITLQSFVRHHLTTYDRLYKIRGLTREEARLIIRDEVKDIIRSWGPEVVLRLVDIPVSITEEITPD